MSEDEFFNEQQEHSRVKAEIVAKYFDAWSRIISAVQDRHGYQDKRLGYIDLFAGPGRYRDGASSTPLKVLEVAVSNPVVAQRLVAGLNDADEDNVHALENAINSLHGIERLTHSPVIWHEEVGDATAARFENRSTIPLLVFIDPWGYKGLTLRLLKALLGDWGSDGIFFFNYNRINPAITNPSVEGHIDAIFGTERANELRAMLQSQKPSPPEREKLILGKLGEALTRYGHQFMLPFTFKSAAANRTSHHLIYIGKDYLGYKVMKDIMGKYSTYSPQGVPSHTFYVSTARAQFDLFDRPLDLLQDLLLSEFQGRTLTVGEIIELHSVNKRYIPGNYKKVLRDLYDRKRITASRKPRGLATFADDIVVTFPG